MPSEEAGALWVVATPIGNLGDFSPRGREALESADTVLCEDTRQGAKLISALGISKPISRLERLDEYASEGSLNAWIARMKKGESFALITDAGTPAISDPGSALVALAHEHGLTVTPVPGPSALVALLSVAGFGETAFTFLGFFPRKDSDRKAALELVRKSGVSRVFSWFESPQRIVDALAAVAEAGPGSQVVASKELTKVHERVFRGTAGEVHEAVRDEIGREGERGEWCFAVFFADSVAAAERPAEEEDFTKALRCLLDAGISASEAAKRVSQVFGVRRNSVYEAALKISGKKNERGG